MFSFCCVVFTFCAFFILAFCERWTLGCISSSRTSNNFGIPWQIIPLHICGGHIQLPHAASFSRVSIFIVITRKPGFGRLLMRAAPRAGDRCSDAGGGFNVNKDEICFNGQFDSQSNLSCNFVGIGHSIVDFVCYSAVLITGDLSPLWSRGDPVFCNPFEPLVWNTFALIQVDVTGPSITLFI